jgi:2-polyprenyl-3-methyl-5-hydroxy-6-metoxy-1,4-benzoquinol methylase
MSFSSSSSDIKDWNRIADAYAQAAQPDDFINRQFTTVLWECLGDVRDLDVLDLGCGAGWLSKQLFERGARV